MKTRADALYVEAADVAALRKIYVEGDLDALYFAVCWFPRSKAVTPADWVHGRPADWVRKDPKGRGWLAASLAAHRTPPFPLSYGVELPSDEERLAAYERRDALLAEEARKRAPLTLEWVVSTLAKLDARAEANQNMQWKWEGHLDFMLLDMAREEGMNHADGMPAGWEDLPEVAKFLAEYSEEAMGAMKAQVGIAAAAQEIAALVRND